MQRIECGVCVCLAAVAFALGGCSGSASVGQWQHQVEEYVWHQANGDLGELRHVGAQGARTFAVLGHNDPQRSTDVVGTLVGTVQAEQRPWMVFMLGTVRDHELQELRPVAVAQHEGEMIWRMGEPDRNALARYETNGPLDRGWPRPGDAFQVMASANPGHVAVTDRETGASWALPLRIDEGGQPVASVER